MKRMLLILALLIAIPASAIGDGPIAPPRRDVPGKRFDLSRGRLFVPDFFSPELSPSTELVLFFHGAAWCSEQNFYDARKNAVIVSISVKNYGYPEVFKNPANLRRILEETTTTLAQNNIMKKPLGRICLASFSGGYSAIREILKHDEFLPLISDVVLADSLYGPRVKGEDRLEPEALAPFLDFARKAASGNGNFIFSHLYPPEKKHRSNTTTIAAEALIEGVGAEKKPASTTNSRGARLLYRADLGNFHVLGYSGMTTQDHFEHFYALSDLLLQTSLTPAPRKNQFPGFILTQPFGEQVKKYEFDPDVKILIHAPNPEKFDPGKPTRIVFFALPNGNTTDQTFGKKVKEGVDWHYGIQHIGAQTRRLREVITDENIIVAYLEAGRRSWPRWKKNHPDYRKIVPRILDSVKNQIPAKKVTLELSSHSGGGSLLFGYIDAFERIPDILRRISFLDSDYGYSDESRHGDKLIEWLRRSPDHHLVVLCYDDRNIRLNGKLVVGPTGGTFRKTHKMIERFEKDMKLAKTEKDDIIRYRGLEGRVEIVVHTNPENRILHTVLVGDMNGFIHACTVGTGYEGKAASFAGPVAYTKWIQEE